VCTGVTAQDHLQRRMSAIGVNRTNVKFLLIRIYNQASRTVDAIVISVN